MAVMFTHAKQTIALDVFDSEDSFCSDDLKSKCTGRCLAEFEMRLE